MRHLPAVAIAYVRELELDKEKVNIYGSGISLGHPIGASGTRILMSLMTGLERENKKYGNGEHLYWWWRSPFQ